MIEIKPADISDIDWILEELHKFSEFYGTKLKLTANEEHVRMMVEATIDNHLFLVATDDDGGVGFIAGFVGTHPFNPSIKTLTEALWWVKEEKRKSRAGLKLLDKFTEWGKNNCDWITFTLEHHSPVNERCLLKRGYKHQETSYILEG